MNSGAATTNYGADGTIVCSDGTPTWRTLIAFEIPPHSTLGAMELQRLRLYLRNAGTGSGNMLFTVANILRSWLEGTSTTGTGATWNTYEGGTVWGTAGAGATTDYGQIRTTFTANGGVAGWTVIDLSDYVREAGLTVGDVINLRIAYYNEDSSGDNISWLSTQSATASPTWPNATDDPESVGAPGSWGTTGSDYYRPVIQVVYSDALPIAPNDVVATPSPSDPSRAQFKFSPCEDADFANYMLRQGTSTPVTGSGGSIVDTNEGGGANKIPTAGTTTLTMSGASTFAENTLYYFRLFTEDTSNTGLYASPSPEIKLIRPDLNTVTNASTGTVPRLFKLSDLTVAPASLAAQDKVTIAVAGLGDNYTASGIVWPTRIDVDFGDGLEPARFTPFVSRISVNVASTDVSVSVENPSGFHVGDAVVLANAVNYEIARVTSVSATAVGIDTDLAGYGQGARYAYTTAQGALLFTVPTHNLPKQFTAANIRARIFGTLGYASDWTATTGSPASAAVNPVAKIDANRNGIGASGDVIRFAGSQSYSRMSDKPITQWQWTGTAATHGGGAVTQNTAVPYWSHTHSFASNCTTELVVTDGTNNSSAASLTITYTAVSNFALTSLLDNYTSRRAKDDPGCIVIDGVDVQESVYSTAKLRYVDYAVSAHRDADADTVPDDLESLISAIVSAKGITDTLPTSTGTASVTGKLYGEVESQQITPAVWVVSFTVVYPRPT